MIRARMTVRVASRKISESLVLAVKPDNLQMAGFSIESSSGPNAAEFHFAYEGRVETFIFTLDDLLRCVQAAKETLDSLTREKLE